jgi:ABC-type glycerol-3-phosphate transport system substrate-binding protein
MTQVKKEANMKRLMIVLFVTLLGPSLLFAGGQKESEGGTAEDQDGEQTQQEEAIRVMGVWTGQTQEKFNEVLAAFEEETGFQADYSPAGSDIGTVVGTQIEGGNPPDVALLPQPGLLQEFADRDALVNLEPVVGDRVDANYAQVWRELGSVDGTLYGVWYKAANKSLVWYNPDIFDQAGVETPETWEEWMQTAQTVSDFGITPFSIGGGDAWTLTDWFENVYIRTAGADMYDQLLNHDIPWTHDSVVEALNRLRQIFSKREWLAGGLQGTLEATHTQGIIQPFLEDPEAAMAYGADFSAGAIINETDAELGTEALFFDFPSIDGSAPSVIGGGDVAVLLEDTEAGRALMRFLASAQAAEVWAPLGGFTSPNNKVDPSVYPSDIVRESARALQEAEVFRFDLSDLQPSAFGGTAGQGLFGILQDFLENPSDVQETAQALEEAAAEAYDR